MRVLVRLILVAVVIAGLAATANAGLIQGTIPNLANSNEFINQGFDSLAPTAKVGGWYGGQLYLIGGPVTILAEYYGGEAGYTNTFVWGSTPDFTFTHNGNSTDYQGNNVEASSTVLVNPGLLPFLFTINSNAFSLVNGTNTDNTGLDANFFVSFDLHNGTSTGNPTSGQFVYIWLDDGGASNDDNHDDMLVKLTITGGNGEFSVVPEPGSMILLCSGLAALWMRRRHR